MRCSAWPSGAKRGVSKVGKAIPLIGTVIVVYFIYEDSKTYGWGPAIANGAVDAIPVVGAGKLLGETIDGQRFLDVTVGPKKVRPAEAVCPNN